jgi:hypothetical protein
MAIASGNFLAAPGAFTTAWSTKLDKIDCSQVLAAVLKADRAILGHIKMGPTAHNIEFNWIEDELNAATFFATMTNSVTVSLYTFTASASLHQIVRDGALIACRDSATASANEWVGKVTSGTEVELVTATYGNTVHTSTSVTCTFYCISNPYGDSDDASSDISKLRVKKSNYMQIFERAIEIAQTRKNMEMEAVSDELQLQIKYRTLELKRELNMTALMGVAYYSGGYSADLDVRTTQGIINYIKNPTMVVVGSADPKTTTDKAGAALTVAFINALLYKIWDQGGLDETADPIIVVGANQQRVIAAMEKDLRRVEQGERQVGYYRDIFLSDMGLELPVVMDRWMPADKLLVLDRSRVSLRALAGDEWHMEKMAKTGRSEKWQLSGQYGLEIRNPDKCHGLLYGLAQ